MFYTRIEITTCVGERLCKECKDVARNYSFVRGHFRVVNGKKVYVRPHYRNK